MVIAGLVQDEFRSPASAIGLEGDLSVDNLQKIILGALWKDLDHLLPSGLRKEMIAFAGDRQDEIRRQFVAANLSIEKFGIDGNWFVLFRGRHLALDPLRVLIAALVKDQPSRLALAVRFEGDLGDDDF